MYNFYRTTLKCYFSPICKNQTRQSKHFILYIEQQNTIITIIFQKYKVLTILTYKQNYTKQNFYFN